MNADVRQRLLKALSVLCLLAVLVLFAASLFILQTDAQGAFVFLLSLPLMALALGAVAVMTAFVPPAGGRRGLRLAALGELLAVALFVAGGFVKPLEPYSDALVAGTRWVSRQLIGMTPWDWAHRARPGNGESSPAQH